MRSRSTGSGSSHAETFEYAVDDLGCGVNRQEIEDIAAFLRALSDPSFFKDEPSRVPSGLPVGGL